MSPPPPPEASQPSPLPLTRRCCWRWWGSQRSLQTLPEGQRVRGRLAATVSRGRRGTATCQQGFCYARPRPTTPLRPAPAAPTAAPTRSSLGQQVSSWCAACAREAPGKAAASAASAQCPSGRCHRQKWWSSCMAFGGCTGAPVLHGKGRETGREGPSALQSRSDCGRARSGRGWAAVPFGREPPIARRPQG